MLKRKVERMSNFQNIVLLHLLLKCGKILVFLNFTPSKSFSLLVGFSKNMRPWNPNTCAQVLATSQVMGNKSLSVNSASVVSSLNVNRNLPHKAYVSIKWGGQSKSASAGVSFGVINTRVPTSHHAHSSLCTPAGVPSTRSVQLLPHATSLLWYQDYMLPLAPVPQVVNRLLIVWQISYYFFLCEI